MIHFRRSVQIAPGRQADAVARAHEWVAIHIKATGVDVRVSVVTTGTLGRLCLSSDFETMGAMEATNAKFWETPGFKGMAKHDQEERDGTAPFVPDTTHDEIWRYS